MVVLEDVDAASRTIGRIIGGSPQAGGPFDPRNVSYDCPPPGWDVTFLPNPGGAVASDSKAVLSRHLMPVVESFRSCRRCGGSRWPASRGRRRGPIQRPSPISRPRRHSRSASVRPDGSGRTTTCCVSTAWGESMAELDEARRRLRRLGAGDVEHPWPTLVLGQATIEQSDTQAIALLEIAADGFVRSREAGGEVLARQNLSNLYRRRGASDAAKRQVEQALSAAEASREPLTIARASVIQANHVLATGGDIGSAHRNLLRAERLAFPGAPIGLRRSILVSPRQRLPLPRQTRRGDRRARASSCAATRGRVVGERRNHRLRSAQHAADDERSAPSRRRPRQAGRRGRSGSGRSGRLEAATSRGRSAPGARRPVADTRSGAGRGSPAPLPGPGSPAGSCRRARLLPVVAGASRVDAQSRCAPSN